MMNVPRERLGFHDAVSAQAEADRRLRERELRETMLAAASRNAPGDSYWFVLSVTNRREIEVKNALEAKNICAWVPMKTIGMRYQRRARRTARQHPIFGGYVFVRVVPLASAFLGLLSVKGVQSILGDSEKPLPVCENYINALNEMVAVGLFDETTRDKGRRQMKTGDRVEINRGAFAFVEAVVEGYRGTRHVRCMAALFGGETPIDVPLANLRKIE